METHRPGLTSDDYGAAVRAAMQRAPVSRREIARRGGLSHTILNRIAAGAGASPEVAEKVGDALVEARDARREEAHEIQSALLLELAKRIRPTRTLLGGDDE